MSNRSTAAALAIVLIIIIVASYFALPLISQYLKNMQNNAGGGEIPALDSPSNGAIIGNKTPTFQWFRFPRADQYRIQVGTNALVSSPLVNETTTNTSYVPASPLPSNSIYFWRVMARSDSNWTNWSETWSVITGSTDFHESYTWQYGGRTWSMSVDIPAATFSSYVSIQRTDNWAGYVTDSDPIIVNMSSRLKQMALAQGYGQYAMVDFTLRFVETIPYLTDESIHGLPEYPQYPIEMLINGGGDCNDKSSLLAALVEAKPIGLDAVLVLLQANQIDHMGVGIAGNGLHGDYYLYNDTSYYYCETTDVGWRVGDIPSDFVHDEVEIVDC